MDRFQYLLVLGLCLIGTLPLELALGVRVWRRPARLARSVLPVAAAFCVYDILAIEPAVTNTATESVRLRRTLRELHVPIDVIVVDEDLARRRSRVRGTMIERALREGRVLAQT